MVVLLGRHNNSDVVPLDLFFEITVTKIQPNVDSRKINSSVLFGGQIL